MVLNGWHTRRCHCIVDQSIFAAPQYLRATHQVLRFCRAKVSTYSQSYRTRSRGERSHLRCWKVRRLTASNSQAVKDRAFASFREHQCYERVWICLQAWGLGLDRPTSVYGAAMCFWLDIYVSASYLHGSSLKAIGGRGLKTAAFW